MSGKSCGECGLCCRLMGVEAIDKPPLTACRQFKKGCGCKIYEARPKACREFVCYWLHLDTLGPEWRPDVAGFVLHLSDGGRRLNVETDPTRPQAWRRAPYHATLLGWAAGGEARGLELVVWTARRATRLTRDGETDLGLMRPRVEAAKPKARLRLVHSV
jgi:hypothetical protein